MYPVCVRVLWCHHRIVCVYIMRPWVTGIRFRADSVFSLWQGYIQRDRSSYMQPLHIGVLQHKHWNVNMFGLCVGNIQSYEWTDHMYCLRTWDVQCYYRSLCVQQLRCATIHQQSWGYVV